jgi:hypothetical protein
MRIFFGECADMHDFFVVRLHRRLATREFCVRQYCIIIRDALPGNQALMRF